MSPEDRPKGLDFGEEVVSPRGEARVGGWPANLPRDGSARSALRGAARRRGDGAAGAARRLPRALQRLGELVTDLYLAEGKSRATKWKQIATALERSGVPKSEIDHLLKKDDVSLLAKKVTELTGK